jgi:hypothetical protein
VEDEITAEIGDGIRAVEDFDLLLRMVKKDDFRKSDEDVEQASVGDMLSASIEHLVATRRAAALDTIRCFRSTLGRTIPPS